MEAEIGAKQGEAKECQQELEDATKEGKKKRLWNSGTVKELISVVLSRPIQFLITYYSIPRKFILLGNLTRIAKKNDTKWINVCDGKPTKTIQSGEHRQRCQKKRFTDYLENTSILTYG